MKTVGILGGMGPEATLLLYELIIKNTGAKSDQEHVPTLIYSNTRIPDRTAAILSQGEDPVPELIKAAKALEAGGAEIIGMPCNTAHYYFDEVQGAVEVEMINMLELAYRKVLEGQLGKRIALFATTGTIATGIYDFGKRHPGISIDTPGEEAQRIIMKTIYEEVKAGKRPMDVDDYRALLLRVEEQGFEGIILGCTELSYLHTVFKFHQNVEFINPLELLAMELIRRARADTGKRKENAK